MSEALAVIRVGMCCPVGLSAPEVATSLWAGVSRKSESPFGDRQFNPIVLGHFDLDLLPPLGADLHHHGQLSPLEARMLRLAAAALAELFVGPFSTLELPLALSLPGGPWQPSEAFLPTLARQVGPHVDLDASQRWTGTGSFFTGLNQRLRDSSPELFVVGGVDSYYDERRLRALDRLGRLRTGGPQDARTPGEAAAFALLARPETCRRHQLQPLAWIMRAETAGLTPTDPRDQPLARALSALVEPMRDGLQLRSVFAGLTGEIRPAREWAVARMRCGESLAPNHEFLHPIDAIGDPGAALGPLLLAYAAQLLSQGSVGGPALIWTGADEDLRGALLLYPRT